MNELSKEDLDILEKQSDDTLADWWCILNRFEVPDGLPVIPNSFTTRTVNIMGWITRKVTLKECLRRWNKDNMTSEEFDIWWEKNTAGEIM